MGSGAKAICVVAGLIVRDDSILVCQRNAAARFPLKWEFPGGKVEAGENPAEALRRELREELAIEVIEAEEFTRYVHRYEGMPPVELLFYRVTKYEGQLKNLIFQQIVWTEVRDLERFDFLEGDLPLIKRLAGSSAGSLTV